MPDFTKQDVTDIWEELRAKNAEKHAKVDELKRKAADEIDTAFHTLFSSLTQNYPAWISMFPDRDTADRNDRVVMLATLRSFVDHTAGLIEDLDVAANGALSTSHKAHTVQAEIDRSEDRLADQLDKHMPGWRAVWLAPDE